MTGLTEAQAALERGRPVLIVTPPAAEQAAVLWDLLGTSAGGARAPSIVLLCPDIATAEAFADCAPAGRRIHPVTGLDRCERLLADGAVDVLAGTPSDLAALVRRTALLLSAVDTVVIAWPEWALAAGDDAFAPLLADAAAARRIVLTWNPQALEAFLERHAHRPHVIGDLPIGDDARPLGPVGPARFATVTRTRRPGAVRDVLDALNKEVVVTWRAGGPPPDRCAAVVCLDLPSRAEFAALRAVAEPILLLEPSQLPYARTLAAPLTPLRLPGPARRAHAATEAFRSQVAARLAAGGLEAELALLEPLLARWDAAEVAAAVLALAPRAAAGAPAPRESQAREPQPEWVKVHLNVGKKDRVGPRDLVGALTRELGLSRDDIGRIEVRDAFSLVSVAPHAAEAALTGLSRVSVRGRRVSARRDREA